MEKQVATRLPAGFWLVCPDGHYVAVSKNGQDVRFNHSGWRQQLRWLEAPPAGSGDFRCKHEGCHGKWFSEYGGQPNIWVTQEAPQT